MVNWFARCKKKNMAKEQTQNTIWKYQFSALEKKNDWHKKCKMTKQQQQQNKNAIT